MTAPVLLFTSLSAKLALYKAVREQAKLYDSRSKVIGADSNPGCQAAGKTELFLKTPPTDRWNLSDLIGFCRKHQITHVVPTRDGELAFWANHADQLKKIGIEVMISSAHALEVCLDKLSLCRDWEANLPIQPIETAVRADDIEASKLVVKERYGSGSRKIGLGLKREEADQWGKTLRFPIFQPYLKGPECSAETWIDRNGKCHGMLLRWRNKTINGESHQTEVFHDSGLEEKIMRGLERISGLRGHCLAQVIVPQDGERKIVEVNPRLGGASPLALYAGIESIRWFLLESAGREKEIPDFPKISHGAKLTKEDKEVLIEFPFPTRQLKL